MLRRRPVLPILFIALTALAVLGGCVPRIYKVEVQQGNVVTPAMVSQLKAGMSKSQVRFALGTPLIIDPFHPDRWDYVYSSRKQGEPSKQYRFSVFFDDDKLYRIDGDAAYRKSAQAVNSTLPLKLTPEITGGEITGEPARPGAPAAGDLP